jgi:hypothetical protein
MGTPANYVYYAINGAHIHEGAEDFFHVPVVYLTGSVSSFTDGQDVTITFVRTGDAGDAGLGGTIANWGSFWDTTDQTAAAADTGYPITLNSFDAGNIGVTVTSGSRINISETGTYDIQFSFQLNQTLNAAAVVDIWLRKNGADVPETATKIDLDKAEKLVAAWNFVVSATAGDYYQLVWSTTNTGVRLDAIAASTTPPIPAVPSAIVTVTQVTYTQIGPTGATGATGATGPTGPGIEGVAVTATELNYLDGVTSNIQTQLAEKLDSSSSTFSGTAANSTKYGGRALFVQPTGPTAGMVNGDIWIKI